MVEAFFRGSALGLSIAVPIGPIAMLCIKRIEEANGWIKEVAGMDRAPFRDRDRMGWMFQFRAAAYNLVRLPRLLAVG